MHTALTKSNPTSTQRLEHQSENAIFQLAFLFAKFEVAFGLVKQELALEHSMVLPEGWSKLRRS